MLHSPLPISNLYSDICSAKKSPSKDKSRPSRMAHNSSGSKTPKVIASSLCNCLPPGHLLPVKSATPSANAPQPISQRILHAGFVVHDRAAEDRFFRDILGFSEGWQGGRNGKTEWIDMRVPDGTDWLEYMLHDPTARVPPDSGVVNHFALGVPDIHLAAATLQHRHWDSSTPPEDPQIGRNGSWQMNLFDPDGTRVELMEFGPVRTPCCSPYTLPTPKVAVLV